MTGNANANSTRWIETIIPRQFSPALLQSFQNLAQGVDNFSISQGDSKAIAPLPLQTQPSSTPSLPINLHQAMLSITHEDLQSQSSITDSTTLTQEIRLTYRLTYLLSSVVGEEWQSGPLEYQAQVSFNESERLSSEYKVQQLREQLYAQAARELLYIALLARPRLSTPSNRATPSTP